MVKAFPKSHFVPVTTDRGADKYCMKDKGRIDGPWEFGTKPLRRDCKIDYDHQFELCLKGEWMKMDKKYLADKYHNLRRIHADLGPQVDPKRTEPRKAFWYWGAPGTGKTRKAHTDHPEHFQKLATKWWCNYQGQKAVVLDDLGRDTAKCLASHLKLWADPWYNHAGEIKGS